jgi:hypothetical protein
MSKNIQHRENIKAWKKLQEDEFLASLPFSEQEFLDLFDFLDEQLEKLPCQHDFKLTKKFLKSKLIDFDKHIDFFIGHGGGCDCEILMNMEELFPNSNENEPIIIQKTAPREKVKELILTDLEIKNIPAPWILFRSDNHYEFQFGKNSDIKITLIESLNKLDWTNEDFWKNQWEKLTELKLKSDCEVIYDKVSQIDLLTVKTKDWIPVLTWIKPTEIKTWGFLFRTELSRFRGDMNEMKNLLKKIENK